MVQGISSNFTDPQVRLQDTTPSQPQAYVVSNETPAAASGVQGDVFGDKKKGKAGKVVGALLVVTAAVATALALLSGKGAGKLSGKLPEWAATKSGTIQKMLNGLNTAGEWISTKAVGVYQSVAGFVQKHLKPAKEAAQGAAETVAETAADVAEKV